MKPEKKKNGMNGLNFFYRQLKYIYIVERINHLYEEHLHRAKTLISSNAIVDIINIIYKYPIFTIDMIEKEINVSKSTFNRYLNILVTNGILDTDGKKRNRTFFCYELLNVLRI